MATESETDSSLLPALTRVVSAFRNAAEIARVGRSGGAAHTPYEVASSDRISRLRHYDGADRAAKRPPLVLVPPLMLTAEVYDIAADASAVRCLMEAGIDPWVVDFGAPERQEGGLRRTLADHVLAVSRAIDAVTARTGRTPHLGGYSQGGMFCYQVAAFRRSQGIASLITFGSPVDVRRYVIPGLPDALVGSLLEGLDTVLSLSFARTALPAWLSRNAFRMLSPTKEIRNQIEFLTRLHDRDTVARREGQRRFLAGEGWVAWPGPALREFIEEFVIQNRLLSGGFVIEGRTLALSDVSCPVLAFIGTGDEIARPGAVRAIRGAAPRADVYEVAVKAGHMGLVVGSRAMKETWPAVTAWIRWREKMTKRPARIRHAPRAVSGDGKGPAATTLAREIGQDVVELVGDAVGEGVDTLRSLARNVVNQLPRLARLQRVRRDTRIGIALALAEQAQSNPQATFFLFGGRAYSYADANRRVDAVVHGLVSVGVRQGQYVGIYMRSRPSALALATAINRLGAVAVFLRPDGDLERELALGEVEHLIADPDNAVEARRRFGRDVLVLGGGGAPRTLPEGLIDMERIDPEQVALPEWYEPSPGRSEEVAFILFSCRGDATRANRITNRRWALSAFGTATAAAMTADDTVYCWTPIQHPTGLLVSISAALVAGARIAMAEGFSSKTFWEEVRRYGASVVFYTGTMCRELVDAARDPAERNHPLRLFAGSGMPAPLWRRLVERFGVSVLEFYASTQATAILANLPGEKIGCVGRPIPGSSRVAIASYDAERDEFAHDASGFCVPPRQGEPGLLLARVERERGAFAGKPLRNVFTKGDAWYPTAELFRRDSDGDYWLVDHVHDLIHHRARALPSPPIEDAVGELDAVSAAAAYCLRLPGAAYEVPAVAVILRPGSSLDPALLAEHLNAKLPPESVPVVVRLVDEIPLTAGYRFQKEPLRAAGLSQRDLGNALYYEAARRRYRPLDAKALRQLAESVKGRKKAGGRKRQKAKAGGRKRQRTSARSGG